MRIDMEGIAEKFPCKRNNQSVRRNVKSIRHKYGEVSYGRNNYNRWIAHS